MLISFETLEYDMKVALYDGSKSIQLQERPDLEAKSGEVIVKIKY